MIMKTDDVWELIRSADPMNSIDVDGAAGEPDAQRLLRRITADDPTVPLAVDRVANVFTASDRSMGGVDRRRGRIAGGLAAAVAVVVIVAAISVVSRQHRGGSTLDPARQATAAGYSKALLSELPLPTGSRPVAAAPIPELRQSPHLGNGILESRIGWWTVPTSFTAAVAAFHRAALPTYWKIPASSTGGAGPSSNGWNIEVRDPRARFVSSLTVVIAAHDNVTGLLAQVDTFAVPVRSAAQIIAPSADSATFTVSRAGGAEYGGFSGARVALLARQINAAPTYVLLPTGIKCAPPLERMTVTLHSGSRQWSLDLNGGNNLCGTLSLTGTSGTHIALTPSAALVKDVLIAAGLPGDYFSR